MRLFLNRLMIVFAATCLVPPTASIAGIFLTPTSPNFGNFVEQILRFDAQTGQSVGSTFPSSMESYYDLKYDTTGNLYLAGMSVGQGGVVRLNPDGTFGSTLLQPFAGGGKPASGIVSGAGLPGRIAFDTNGILYASTSNSSSSGAILKFNGQSGVPLGTFAGFSATSGDYVTDLELGPDNLLYASWSKSGVKRYASNGTPSTIVPNLGGDLMFGADNDLYLLNNNAILKYTSSGSLIGTLVPSNPARPQLTQMTFGPDGDIYAIELSHLTIDRFDGNTGASLGTFASLSGYNAGQESFYSIAYSSVPEPARSMVLSATILAFIAIERTTRRVARV
jgi:hypothetical protein